MAAAEEATIHSNRLKGLATESFNIILNIFIFIFFFVVVAVAVVGETLDQKPSQLYLSPNR